MELVRGDKGRFIRPTTPELVAEALERFRRYCQPEPETGCVIWTGGTRSGRGHHVPYPNFWFNGKSWHGHRWSAKFIHGQDIEGFHTDHCCPNIPIPNTLCVEHVQSITPRQNRELQFTRRRDFVYLQVGLLKHKDLYGYDLDPETLQPPDAPFFPPPAWLIGDQANDHDACPF